MPLFTVTMKSNRSTNEKDRLSRAVHAASIAAGNYLITAGIHAASLRSR
jgi:hypothetical protein